MRSWAALVPGVEAVVAGVVVMVAASELVVVMVTVVAVEVKLVTGCFVPGSVVGFGVQVLAVGDREQHSLRLACLGEVLGSLASALGSAP